MIQKIFSQKLLNSPGIYFLKKIHTHRESDPKPRRNDPII